MSFQQVCVNFKKINSSKALESILKIGKLSHDWEKLLDCMNVFTRNVKIADFIEFSPNWEGEAI